MSFIPSTPSGNSSLTVWPLDDARARAQRLEWRSPLALVLKCQHAGDVYFQSDSIKVHDLHSKCKEAVVYGITLKLGDFVGYMSCSVTI